MQNSEKFRENLAQNLELSNNKRYRKIITLNIRILPYSRFSNLSFSSSNVSKEIINIQRFNNILTISQI